MDGHPQSSSETQMVFPQQPMYEQCCVESNCRLVSVRHQHADLPPRDAPEILDQVLFHVNASQECRQALEIAKTFMLRQETVSVTMKAPHIAPEMPGHPVPESSQNPSAPADSMSRSEAGRLICFTPSVAVRIQ
jgi:hypothetical protein